MSSNDDAGTRRMSWSNPRLAGVLGQVAQRAARRGVAAGCAGDGARRPIAQARAARSRTARSGPRRGDRPARTARSASDGGATLTAPPRRRARGRCADPFDLGVGQLVVERQRDRLGADALGVGQREAQIEVLAHPGQLVDGPVVDGRADALRAQAGSRRRRAGRPGSTPCRGDGPARRRRGRPGGRRPSSASMIASYRWEISSRRWRRPSSWLSCGRSMAAWMLVRLAFQPEGDHVPVLVLAVVAVGRVLAHAVQADACAAARPAAGRAPRWRRLRRTSTSSWRRS